MTSISNSLAAPSKKVNLKSIKESRSPEDQRKKRDDHRESIAPMKVRSLAGNARKLRGGDWISCGAADGQMTLAVAWKRGPKQYGLTVYHPFHEDGRRIGSGVYAFNSDVALPFSKPSGDVVYKHKAIQIGNVVSIDAETDSLVFEIFPNIEIDPFAVALSGDDNNVCYVNFPKPDSLSPNLPDLGTKLVMYGAARRGMIGSCVEMLPNDDALRADKSTRLTTRSFDSNDGVVNGETKLSFGGDCGALYIDEDGAPWGMHTTIYGTKSDNKIVWTSRGALLSHIVEGHRFYFSPVSQSVDSQPSTTNGKSKRQSLSGSKSFDLRIEATSPITNESYPRLHFETPKDHFWEKQPFRNPQRLSLFFPEDYDDDAGMKEEKKSEP